MLNMVWKSTEGFGNLSLEKYGILKWKMYRNPGGIHMAFHNTFCEKFSVTDVCMVVFKVYGGI